MYIRCLYGIFEREITIHTVIYGVYIRFWPSLSIPGLQALLLHKTTVWCAPPVAMHPCARNQCCNTSRSLGGEMVSEMGCYPQLTTRKHYTVGWTCLWHPSMAQWQRTSTSSCASKSRTGLQGVTLIFRLELKTTERDLCSLCAPFFNLRLSWLRLLIICIVKTQSICFEYNAHKVMVKGHRCMCVW